VRCRPCTRQQPQHAFCRAPNVVAAAGDYTDAQISEIESAREGFDDAVSEIPDSATFGDAQLALQTALEGFFEAVGPALDTQCPAAE